MDILSQGSSPALVTMYSNPQFKLEIGSNVKKLKMMGGGGEFSLFTCRKLTKGSEGQVYSCSVLNPIQGMNITNILIHKNCVKDTRLSLILSLAEKLSSHSPSTPGE